MRSLRLGRFGNESRPELIAASSLCDRRTDRWLTLIDVGSLEWLRLWLGEVRTLRHSDGGFTLRLVQFVLEVVLHALELVRILRLVDHGFEGEFLWDCFLWFVRLAKGGLFHAAGHACFRITFFSCLLNSLLTFQFLLLQVFLIEWE